MRGLWRAQGHDGYPNDRVFLKDGSVNAIIWDPATRLMKGPDVHDFGTRCVEKLGENQYKFTLSHSQEYDIKPGDYITVSRFYALHLRHASFRFHNFATQFAPGRAVSCLLKKLSTGEGLYACMHAHGSLAKPAKNPREHPLLHSGAAGHSARTEHHTDDV